jgi:pimeloyl-ACP methyl ester carboxylesterase
MTTTTTLTLTDTEVTLTDRGEGHPVLLLHGGGGPLTVTPWADRLAETRPARVLTPTHPGFAGTPRPDSLDSIAGLAALYVELLEELDLSDVTVVGNSIGGWIAAEMAVLGPSRVSGYVLVDAVGIEVEGHPVADFFNLTFAEVAELSYADPATHAIDPADLPPAARQAMAGNRAALQVYAGTTMADPTLLGRLGTVSAPTLVVWGAADRIGDVDLGRAYAHAVPGASFDLLPDSGHLPQVETPEELVESVWSFVARSATATHALPAKTSTNLW